MYSAVSGRASARSMPLNLDLPPYMIHLAIFAMLHITDLESK